MKFRSKIFLILGLALISLSATLAAVFLTNLRKEAERQKLEKGQALLALAEESRIQMGEKYKLGILTDLRTIQDPDPERRKYRILQAVPVLTAMNTLRARTNEGNYIFRVPKTSPRNPENEPDAFELAMLNRMERENLDQVWGMDRERNAIRIFRSIKLTAECMACHGDPATSRALWGRDDGRDITGGPMENWKVGERHGAFEILAPMHDVDRQMRRSTVLVILATLAIIALIFAAVAWIFRPIQATVNDAVHFAGALARGDLTAAVRSRSRDEFGVMARALVEGAEKLGNTFAMIRDASGQVGAASSQLAQGNQDLSRRTEAQAASVEETAASMEEMSSSIKGNTQGAQEANALSLEAAGKAGEGVGIVGEVVEAMEGITQSSQKMRQIIEVMNQIAFQTNLLALNASIEAARAGEQGRGFAVVAVEVRKLAQRSDEASREIAALIGDSIRRVEAGSDLAKRAGGSLGEINAAVTKVKDLIAEIASASREQWDGVEQINKTILSLDQNTQMNSSLVEEAAAATEELSSQAEELNALVAQFKIRMDRAIAAPEESGPSRVATEIRRIGNQK